MRDSLNYGKKSTLKFTSDRRNYSIIKNTSVKEDGAGVVKILCF